MNIKFLTLVLNDEISNHYSIIFYNDAKS